MAAGEERTVYLYTDDQGTIRYVGRGSWARAQSHTSRTHNPRLAKLIESGNYSLEAAQCKTPEAAEAVEAALIDVLSRSPLRVGLFNDRSEPAARRFAPLGVPAELADRLEEKPADPGELARVHGGVLYVRLDDGELTGDEDERGAVNPLNPDPVGLGDRIRRKWLLGAWPGGWERDPNASPRIVAGVAGPRSRRYIIGALYIDPAGWAHRETYGARSAVPLRANPGSVTDADLDADCLRGRQVTLAFGRFPHEHARYFDAQGTQVVYRPDVQR